MKNQYFQVRGSAFDPHQLAWWVKQAEQLSRRLHVFSDPRQLAWWVKKVVGYEQCIAGNLLHPPHKAVGVELGATLATQPRVPTRQAGGGRAILELISFHFSPKYPYRNRTGVAGVRTQ